MKPLNRTETKLHFDHGVSESFIAQSSHAIIMPVPSRLQLFIAGDGHFNGTTMLQFRSNTLLFVARVVRNSITCTLSPIPLIHLCEWSIYNRRKSASLKAQIDELYLVYMRLFVVSLLRCE